MKSLKGKLHQDLEDRADDNVKPIYPALYSLSKADTIILTGCLPIWTQVGHRIVDRIKNEKLKK